MRLKESGVGSFSGHENTVGISCGEGGSGFLTFGIFRFDEQVRYHLYRKEADMRMSFDALCGLVRNELGREVNRNDAYIFINKAHTHLKLLVDNSSGFTLLYYRLAKGTFTIPVFDLDSRCLHLRAGALSALLGNIRVR